VHVRGIVWRLACTNGLRAPSSTGDFSFRHVGETQRLRDCVADAVPTALAHASGLMGRWQQAVGVMVDRVAEMIDAMRDLNLGERKAVQEELKSDLGVPELPAATSVYDLVNAVTGAARQSEPARRLEIESLAGEILHRHTRAVS
jgi:hypothetical protein